MKFVNVLTSGIASGFNFLGDMLAALIRLISKPLTFLLSLLESIFYLIYQLGYIVVKVIMIFVALLQFFGAIVIGFLRTVFAMLTINYGQTPLRYPDSSIIGLNTVLDVIRPMGLLTVVPGIVLAITWFIFIKRFIGLLGSRGVSGE